LRQIR